jgi:hypothetical protein
VLSRLERAGLTTVQQVVERLAEGERGLLKLKGIGPKSLSEIQRRLALFPSPEKDPVPEAAAGGPGEEE